MVMELNKIYEGNCLDVIKTLPNNSIDCIITSSPYYQLRKYEGIPDYVWDGDSNCEHDFSYYQIKGQSGGASDKQDSVRGSHFDSSEQGFCNKCGAWKGQLGLEPTFELFIAHLVQIVKECKRVLKDTGTIWWNIGDTYNGNKQGNDDPKLSNEITNNTGVSKKVQSIPNKSLLLVPHRFAIRCCDELGLIIRNDIIWAKPNAMPESVTDRFSKKHEYFFLMSKNEKYYFDLDSIRDNHISNNKIKKLPRGTQDFSANANIGSQQQAGSGGIGRNEQGKNPGSVSDFWDINTKPSKDKHYASYNTELIDKPIIAGCPKDGIILDPFCGTATTGCRAIDLQRKFIGIEGSSEYVKIATKKLLPYQITQQLF